MPESWVWVGDGRFNAPIQPHDSRGYSFENGGCEESNLNGIGLQAHVRLGNDAVLSSRVMTR
jgi:hypothetical protein